MEARKIKYFVHRNFNYSSYPNRDKWYGIIDKSGQGHIFGMDGKIDSNVYTARSYDNFIKNGYWITKTREQIMKLIRQWKRVR